jgi:hypothetical protein
MSNLNSHNLCTICAICAQFQVFLGSMHVKPKFAQIVHNLQNLCTISGFLGSMHVNHTFTQFLHNLQPQGEVYLVMTALHARATPTFSDFESDSTTLKTKDGIKGLLTWEKNLYSHRHAMQYQNTLFHPSKPLYLYYLQDLLHLQHAQEHLIP